MNLPSVPANLHRMLSPQAIRRRARGLNIDKMSDSDAVDAFCGVVNSLVLGNFRGINRGSHAKDRLQVRWSAPDESRAAHDAQRNIVTLPWPGPVVEPEKYLALRGYTLEEYGRMRMTHPELYERVRKNGGQYANDAAAVAGILESRRISQTLEQEFGAVYGDARAQIVRDCLPTPEQQAEFDQADPPTKLLNDFTVIARDLPYPTSSPSSVVDRIRQWLKIARSKTPQGMPPDSLGYELNFHADSTRAAQHSANLAQIFVTAFKDVLDQRDPNSQNPSGGSSNNEGDGNGQGEGQSQGQGSSGASMQDQMQQGLQSGADKSQYYQCVAPPTDPQQDVAGSSGADVRSSEDFSELDAHHGIPGLVECLRKRGARVASTLRRALAAKSRFGDETDMDDGDLDPDKLVDIARGKWDAPFMRPGRIIHDRDTAVHICLDGSGSMNDLGGEGGEAAEFISKIKATGIKDPVEAFCSQMDADAAASIRELAAIVRSHIRDTSRWDAGGWVSTLLPSKIWVSGAAMAIHDALRQSRIAHEVSAFAGPYVVLKNWKQRGFPPNIQAIFQRGGFACGGTPAGSSWKNSLGSLLKRRETRRILIVMSDGSISGYERTLGTAVISAARELGIECYGFGIMSPGVRDVFPRGDKSVVTVEYGDDLNRRMQDLVHGILTKSGDK